MLKKEQVENFQRCRENFFEAQGPIFKQICKRIDKMPEKDDFNCAQMRDGYSIAYAPDYPRKTEKDFSIWISGLGKGTSFYDNNGMLTSMDEIIESHKEMKQLPDVLSFFSNTN